MTVYTAVTNCGKKCIASNDKLAFLKTADITHISNIVFTVRMGKKIIYHSYLL